MERISGKWDWIGNVVDEIGKGIDMDRNLIYLLFFFGIGLFFFYYYLHSRKT